MNKKRPKTLAIRSKGFNSLEDDDDDLALGLQS
jgi:hypothetical protein